MIGLRLNSWLVLSGGVRDPGGDVLSVLGGSVKARPGLVNNTSGMPLDDAAHAAWEAGYFFGRERPAINELLDLMAQDHAGRIPVWAEGDFAEVAERRERLASERDDPAGELLARIVRAWHEGGPGKRLALRALMREAEGMV